MIENKKYFIGQKIIKTKDYYWVVSSTINVIWKCDLSFNVVDYYIFEEESAIEDLFRAVVCVNEIIYLFPFNARSAYKFDINKNNIQKIDMDILGNETKHRKFSYAFVVNDLIIVVGRNVGGFLKYDLHIGTTTLVTNGWPFKGDYVCSFAYCIKGKRAYTVSVLDASVVAFDYINNDIVCYDFSEYCSNNLTTIISDDKYIYITNDRCEVLKLDDTLSVLTTRKIEGWDDKNIRLAGIEKEKFWCLGNILGKMLIEIKEMTTSFELDVELDVEYGYCFTAVELYEKELLLQSRKTGEIICFDFEKETKNRVDITISDVLMEKCLFELMKCIFNRREMIKEDTELCLKKFLEVI